MGEKKLVEYLLEAILQVFRIINKKIEDFKKIGDISGIEKLEKEVIPLYEKFYNGLKEFSSNENSLKKEEFENIKINVDNILKVYSIDEKFVVNQMELRKKNKDNSGSEVVKNLFEYEHKKLLMKKGDLTRKINQLLDKEEEFNKELSDAMQEVDQLGIIDKLLPVREEYRKVEKEFLAIYDKITEIDNKLEKKWYYEIYGTMSKEEMLKMYKEK